MGRLCPIAILCLFCMCGCSKDDPQPWSRPVPTTISECLAGNLLTVSNIWGVPADVEIERLEVEMQGAEWGKIYSVSASSQGRGRYALDLMSGRAEIQPSSLMKAGRSDATDYTGCWPAAIDNPDAAVAVAGDIFAYIGESRVGRVFLSDWPGDGTKTGRSFIYFHYADREFSLSGYNFTINPDAQKSYFYEASFSGGWQAYAMIKQSDNMTLCTTAIPPEMKLFWCFESFGNYP